MKIQRAILAGALALAAAGTAGAASFSPASGGIAVLGAPSVTANSATFSSPTTIFGTTGSLTAASGSGTVSGTLDFSQIAGTVLPQSIMDFMVFDDTSGGTFNFDISSVQTVSYSSTAASTSIVLYLLGSAEDTNLSLTSAPTSETITLNSTGGSVYSASASIQAPPAGVPEPASWALMMVGFGIAGAAIRTRARQVAA